MLTCSCFIRYCLLRDTGAAVVWDRPAKMGIPMKNINMQKCEVLARMGPPFGTVCLAITYWCGEDYDSQGQGSLAGAKGGHRKPFGTRDSPERGNQYQRYTVCTCSGVAPAILGKREAAGSGSTFHGRNRRGNCGCA